ncbi:MAG: transposase, family, partial [Eubacteriales bacterium]|nr:transposase, family [Eubacteriales bacterium]
RRPKKSVGRVHKRLCGKSISERAESIDERQEFGHWEMDTVSGKRSADQPLLTLPERKTRHRLILLLTTKNAEAVEEALKQLQSQYGSVFPHLFKSITAANGTEFANLSKHGIEVYYAHPYSAWGWATDERHNGLIIRRFIPT